MTCLIDYTFKICTKTLLGCSVKLLPSQRQVEHGVLRLARHVLLNLQEVGEVELRGGDGGVGLEQHQPGVGAGVDVQLVILVPPSEASPGLLYRDISISVRLQTA